MLLDAGLQIIWQTGKPYAEKGKLRAEGKQGVWVNEFITQMEYAYAAADIVVARAGAMTVAELCVAKNRFYLFRIHLQQKIIKR